MKTNFLLRVLIALLLITGCKKSEYTKLVKSELDKNILKNELIFGMKLGDSRQEFYDICWQLNKEEKVKQGPKNSYVQYKLPLKDSTETTKQITLLFYGTFNKEKIMTGLDMKFYYDAWSLWNATYHNDKLLPVIKDTLTAWFPGNEFIPVKLKKSKEEILVKVDGNRRIIIEPFADTREIDVRIDDLRFTKGLNK